MSKTTVDQYAATERRRQLMTPVWLLVAGCAAIAAVTNWHQLGRQSFWQDEGITASIATSTSDAFWHAVTSSHGNMAGYYALLRAWPFHGTEQGIRALSVLFVVATVPVIYWIGRDLVHRQSAGVWACAFFALWPFVVQYGQEARSYSLLTLLATAATAALLKATRDGTEGWWLAYGALLGLGLYAHLYAVLIVLPHVVWILLRRPPFRGPALAAVAAAVVASPMIAYFAARFGSDYLSWIPAPTASFVFGHVIAPMMGSSHALPVLLALATVALTAAAVAGRFEMPVLALLTAWAFLPAAFALGYSLAFQPILEPRFLIISVPAWTLILGIAITQIRKPGLSAIVGAVVLLACGRAVQAYYSSDSKPQIRQAAEFVAAHSRAGDSATIDAGLNPAVNYYWRNDLTVPESGVHGDRLWVINPGGRQVPPNASTARWRLPANASTADWRLQQRKAFYGVVVALYVPVPASRTSPAS